MCIFIWERLKRVSDGIFKHVQLMLYSCILECVFCVVYTFGILGCIFGIFGMYIFYLGVVYLVFDYEGYVFGILGRAFGIQGCRK